MAVALLSNVSFWQIEISSQTELTHGRDWTSLVIVANYTILNVNRMGILLHFKQLLCETCLFLAFDQPLFTLKLQNGRVRLC